jgi:type II secretory pathway component PulK
MAIEVTLILPENLIEQARRLGSATQRDAGVVLADALDMMWLPIEESASREHSSVENLADDEVLTLANSKMDEVQNQRLGDLQAKGKAIGLSEAECYELLALLQIYQMGQLRKSEALVEAVHRGLQTLPMA